MNAAEKKAYGDFQALMKRIAAKNEDEFKVTMTTDLDGHHIEVIETADRHTFLDGNGATIEEAVTDAINGIPAALESWGYEGVHL
jgi:hypothetical protein